MKAVDLKRQYEAQIEAACGPGAGDGRHSRREFRGMLRAAQALPAKGLKDDGRIWVWSDLHLGHGNIIRYADRPFADAESMDATLYENWATTVGPDDTLLFVGDIAMRKAVAEHTWERIRSSAGRTKLLVFGNHDLTGNGTLRVDGFDDVCSVLSMDGDPPLLFTHMPLADVPADCVNVHGHTHGEAPRASRHINVSVEQLDYRPVALPRIRALARALRVGYYPDGRTTLERMQRIGC